MRIVITGVPGSGKTTLAKALAKKLNCEYIDLNAIAKKRAVLRKVGKEFEINLKKLEKIVGKLTSGKKNFVLEGHLACEVKIPRSLVIIFRCNPLVLISRLKRRKYPKGKIVENALVEAQDYFPIKVEKNYGKTYVEVDTTKKLSCARLKTLILRRKTQNINWNVELFHFASQGL